VKKKNKCGKKNKKQERQKKFEQIEKKMKKQKKRRSMWSGESYSFFPTPFRVLLIWMLCVFFLFFYILKKIVNFQRYVYLWLFSLHI
jgi:uncharacterized membrane protein (DUF106 family)